VEIQQEQTTLASVLMFTLMDCVALMYHHGEIVRSWPIGGEVMTIHAWRALRLRWCSRLAQDRQCLLNKDWGMRMTERYRFIGDWRVMPRHRCRFWARDIRRNRIYADAVRISVWRQSYASQCPTMPKATF